MKPNSKDPNSLEITGDSKPTVSVFTCIIYLEKSDGIVTGRVANLSGIKANGASERDVLRKLTLEFKSQVLKMSEDGQEIPWLDPPSSPLESELVRSVPMHL